MESDFMKIIEDSVWAPSGDNSQPWMFRIDKNTIDVVNVPEKDGSLYNFNQNASFFSHGALIENINISSEENGYRSDIHVFPDSLDDNLVAKIKMEKVESKKSPLYPFIRTRSTNRRPYNEICLTSLQTQVFLNMGKYGQVKLVIIDNKESIKRLAYLASTNEKIVLENQELHKFLFQHIGWNDSSESNEAKMHIDTLELKFPQKIIFKLAKNWMILRILNKIGLSRIVSKENAKIYGSSCAIGIIVSPNNSKLSYLESGRLMQRIWLEACRKGISIQPLTGITFLAQRVITGDFGGITSSQASLVMKTYGRIKDEFRLNNVETITFMFRLGFADSPTKRSLRSKPIIYC